MTRSRCRFIASQAAVTWFTGLSWCGIGHADPIHAIGAGAFRHHDSDWIFPPQVAGFSLVGFPQDQDGTAEAIAHYAQVVNEARTTVTVDICPRQLAPSLAVASAAIEPRAVRDKQSDSTFEVGSRHMVGTRVWYDESASSSQSALYFIDTGAWIVRITMHTDAGVDAARLDNFVRDQQWEQLISN
jgi:hypothetical protein